LNDPKLKNYLEATTNVAVILVAIVVLSAFAWNFLKRGQQMKIQAGLQRGQKLSELPIVTNDNATQTLLVAMNTSCHYCNESVPFYNQLAEIQHDANNKILEIAM